MSAEIMPRRDKWVRRASGAAALALLAAAFMGAERVAKAGRVRVTKAHEAVLERWRMSANPLQQFLSDDEWVELDPEARTHSTADLYETYRRWASSTSSFF